MTLFISPARGRVFQGVSRAGPSQAARNSPPSSSLPAVCHQKSAPGRAGPAAPEPNRRLGSPGPAAGGCSRSCGCKGMSHPCCSEPGLPHSRGSSHRPGRVRGPRDHPALQPAPSARLCLRHVYFFPRFFHSLIGLFSQSCQATAQGPALASARGAPSLTKPRSRQGRPALSERRRSSLQAAASPDKERGHAGLLRAQVRSGRWRPLPSSERVFVYTQGSCDGNGWGWCSASPRPRGFSRLRPLSKRRPRHG